NVPERETEIVDQHLAARFRMPGSRIERRQEIVDIARASVEVDLGGKRIDQAVDLVEMTLHERLRVALKILDFACRRFGRKDRSHQRAHTGTVVGRIFAAPQRVEPHVKLPLEPIDNERIETSKALLIEQLVEAVLALDQEMQAPFPVLHVEGQE